MRRLLPDSIASRTALVLLVGLTLSHAVSMLINYSDRVDALALEGGGQIAGRIASIARLVDEASPGEREHILRAINSPTLRVSLDRASALPDGEQDSLRVRIVKQLLTLQLGGIEDRRVRVVYREGLPAGSQPFRPGSFPMMGGSGAAVHPHMRQMMANFALGRGLAVSILLSDGGWLNFAAPVTDPAAFWSLRLVLSMAVMALAVIGLSIWAVRRLTGPLSDVAEAAERIGFDVKAAPLAERGPREVRQAARTFNEMQRRIRRFVEDRTQMIAAISHDLRTPITRLRLRAEFVEDETQREKMLGDLDEMEKMISATLAFARDDAGDEEREVVDFVSLVQSACDDLSDAGRPITFRGEGRQPYACRPLAMRRALTNLLDNAVKYGRQARVEVSQSADNLVVRIDDDGPGIPESEHERVFAPFYRLERSRSRDTGGAGLGLAFARGVIRTHGGDIAIANRPEGGLRVTVSLPLSQAGGDGS